MVHMVQTGVAGFVVISQVYREMDFMIYPGRVKLGAGNSCMRACVRPSARAYVLLSTFSECVLPFLTCARRRNYFENISKNSDVRSSCNVVQYRRVDVLFSSQWHCDDAVPWGQHYGERTNSFDGYKSLPVVNRWFAWAEQSLLEKKAEISKSTFTFMTPALAVHYGVSLSNMLFTDDVPARITTVNNPLKEPPAEYDISVTAFRRMRQHFVVPFARLLLYTMVAPDKRAEAVQALYGSRGRATRGRRRRLHCSQGGS